MGLFSYDNDGSTVTVAAAGGASTTDIDVTFTGGDHTYTETAGVLQGGTLAGWKVNNFAGFTHIKDVNADSRLEMQLNQSGQMRCDIVNSWPTDAPYIYKEVEAEDDFDLIIKGDVATGGDLDKALTVFAGYPDNDDKTYDHLVALQWGAWNSTQGKMEMIMSRPGTSPIGFAYDIENYGTDHYLRLTRSGATIRWRWSTNGTDWTELNVAGGREIDVAGSRVRIGFGCGSNASPSTDTFYVSQIKWSYIEAS